LSGGAKKIRAARAPLSLTFSAYGAPSA